MRIRTYLMMSYLALVVLITAAAVMFGQMNIEHFAADNLGEAEAAVTGLAAANYEMSEAILTSYGERIVELQAESTAKELSCVLGGRHSYDYDQIRSDAELRKIGTREIRTVDSVAGYITIGDKTGVSVLHPKKEKKGSSLVLHHEEIRTMVPGEG